jgi:hypothetical protein
MEAEAHALVVSAEGEPAEARFFRAGLVGMATEFADGVYGGVDVSDREEDIDAALLVLVVEPTADRRSLDPRLVAVSHRVEGPLTKVGSRVRVPSSAPERDSQSSAPTPSSDATVGHDLREWLRMKSEVPNDDVSRCFSRLPTSSSRLHEG